MKNKIIFIFMILTTAFFGSCFLLSTDYEDDSHEDVSYEDGSYEDGSYEDGSYEGGSNELINLNPDRNGEPWLAGGLILPSEDEIEKIPRLSSLIESERVRVTLPTSVDNSQKKYFRGIFGQQGGSCAQASAIGYTYTYEMNLLKNTDARQLANQFPSGYTYNFINGGRGSNGSWMWWGWDIIGKIGIPTSDVYGGINGGNQYKTYTASGATNYTCWMSGYDSYYSGLTNSVDNQFTITVSTVSGLNSLKAYLAHHGIGSADGGIVNFAAGASNGQIIPSGTYAGKRYVHLWGTQVNHAMTIVGYDDNVLIDYNGDGKYTNNIDINNDNIIDLKDYERGALIVANSWGTGWANNGFIYMPYRLCALPSNVGGIFSSRVYGVKVKNVETPKFVMKVRMKHNRRDLVNIKIGVNQNTSASNYSYSLTKNDFSGNRGAYSFLGESSPGVMDNNPITFAFDCTELFMKIDPTKGFKIFLEITENDVNGIGNGVIEYASLIDYRTGTVKETVITGTSKPILNNRNTLLLTTLYGSIDRQPPTAPRNLSAYNIQRKSVNLRWRASSDNIGVVKYNIYRNGKYIMSSSSTNVKVGNLRRARTYNFYVKAVDAAGNLSGASNKKSVTTKR